MKVEVKDGFLTVRLDDGRKATVRHEGTASGTSERTGKAIMAAYKVAMKQKVPIARERINKEPKSKQIIHQITLLAAELSELRNQLNKAVIEESPYKLDDLFINDHGEVAKVTYVDVLGGRLKMRVFTQSPNGEFNKAFANLGVGRWEKYWKYKGPIKQSRVRKPKGTKV